MGISAVSFVSSTINTTVLGNTANASNTANSSDTASNLSNEADRIAALLEEIQGGATLLDVLSDDDNHSSYSGNNLLDILDLSEEGQSLADELTQMMDSTMQSSIRRSSNVVSASMADKVDKALTAAGIDTSKQIDLQVDSDGNIVVTNDHPQADAIEEAINDNPALKISLGKYLEFMQTMAPKIATDAGSDGTVTFSLLGSEYMATYVDSTDSSFTLCAS